LLTLVTGTCNVSIIIANQVVAGNASTSMMRSVEESGAFVGANPALGTYSNSNSKRSFTSTQGILGRIPLIYVSHWKRSPKVVEE